MKAQGFAIDDAEAAEGLYCVAVALPGRDGEVKAAVSVSRALEVAEAQGNDRVLEELRRTVSAIRLEIA